MVLSVAGYGYVLETGTIACEGKASALASDEKAQAGY
jgi:ABC-type branched-subunit amino acid transport system ATPase component